MPRATDWVIVESKYVYCYRSRKYKYVYPDKDDALSVAEAMREREVRELGDDAEVEVPTPVVYICNRCPGYHVSRKYAV